MKKYYELVKVADLQNEEPEGRHPMVVYHNEIFVIDGKVLYSYAIPPETLWQRLKRFLGIK